MADFELEVDISASTSKLEQGAKKSEQIVSRSASVIEEQIETANATFEGMIATIGKVAAGLFLAEGAFKAGSAVAAAFSGDAQGVADALKSMPVIGPLITSIYDFADALEKSGRSAREARIQFADLALEIDRASDMISTVERSLQLQDEIGKLQGLTQVQILANRTLKERLLLDERLAVAQAKIREQFEARIEKQKELGLGADEERANIRELRRDMNDALRTAEFEIELRREVLGLRMQEAEASAVKAREEEEAAKAAKESAEFQERYKRIQEEQKKRQEELKKLEEERQKKAKEAAERELEFARARFKVEKEISEARAEAELAVAGATATFSTAGGSFTTGVSAQVNEQKLLTKISEQSRDFLSQIVRNTAALRAGGFA